MAVNRQITGNAYSSRKAFVKPSISLSNQGKLLSSAADFNTICWHIHKSGDYLYASTNNKGISVIDVSNPASPSVTDTEVGTTYRIRGSVVIGGTLVTCARTANGEIETWDITNPAAIVSQDSYIPAGTEKYSAIDTDGTYAYVASQVAGLHVFDVSTPTVIAEHGSLTTGTWETQGLAVHNAYAFMANYNNGLRIVDIATPATPGAVTDREIACPIYNGNTLRIWECAADGNYLYASVNLTTTQYDTGGSAERGLLVLDITDPTTIPTNGSTWIRAQIPAADQDVWNRVGDNPYIGITKLGNYVYMGAGHGGVFIWDVTDPTNPIYKGLRGNQDSGDNIYGVVAWNDANKTYVAYGDGANEVGAGSNQVYVDEVV